VDVLDESLDAEQIRGAWDRFGGLDDPLLKPLGAAGFVTFPAEWIIGYGFR